MYVNLISAQAFVAAAQNKKEDCKNCYRADLIQQTASFWSSKEPVACPSSRA